MNKTHSAYRPKSKRESPFVLHGTYSGNQKAFHSQCDELRLLAERIHRANLDKTKQLKIKDSEIDKLNDEILHLKNTNDDMEKTINHELSLRKKYEKEQKSLADYCNSLSHKFRNMDQTINEYETIIKDLKKENEKIADDYDKKIEQLDFENKKLSSRIDNRIELFNHQKNEILDKEGKANLLSQEIQSQEDIFKERAKTNKKNFDTLKAQYDELLKKVCDLQMVYGIKAVNGPQNTRNFVTKEQKEEQYINDKKQEIKHIEASNVELQDEINELTKKHNDMRNTFFNTTRSTNMLSKSLGSKLTSTGTKFNSFKNSKFPSNMNTKSSGFYNNN